MRGFGLDAHRDFCEVAIAEAGEIRSAGRIPARVASLEVFADSLLASDVVALEATSGAERIVSVLQARGVRVIVANTRRLNSISQAKAKTDRLDARTLARLLVSGLLAEVWTPDERTRTLRRLTNHRERIVRARSRAKNEAHGVLARNLCERSPVTDAFGKAGRRWFATLELPVDERLTLDGCLRQVDFLEAEVEALDRAIAKHALAWPEVLRLMSVPGVNVNTAATFMASVGDIRRFSSPRKLVSYLGLDPRVRQSGSTPARHGHISKEGPSETRHMLGEVGAGSRPNRPSLLIPIRVRIPETVESAIPSVSAISGPLKRNRRSAAIASIRSSPVRCGIVLGAEERSNSPSSPSARSGPPTCRHNAS